MMDEASIDSQAGRMGLAGPASGRGGKGRSAFRLLTRPGFVNCDTLRLVNCGATASAPSLQMEMNYAIYKTTKKEYYYNYHTESRADSINHYCVIMSVTSGKPRQPREATSHLHLL